MKIFFSWSGPTSQKIAETFSIWLPKVIQSTIPFFSKDLAKGSQWFSEISTELKESKLGVVFLTKENSTEPWIMFEAGALANQTGKAKAIPITFGLKPSEIEGPLAQLQLTQYEEEEILKLLKTINNSSEDAKLENSVLEDTFKKWWPDLDEKIKAILNSQSTTLKKPERPDREILEEILGVTRAIAYKQTGKRIRIIPKNVKDSDGESEEDYSFLGDP